MKFINVPISVEARKGVPRRIRWGRRIYTVRRLLDFWILQTRWWAREEKRVYFRLETDRGVVEVYRGEGEGEKEGEKDRGSQGGESDPRLPTPEPCSRSAPKQRKAPKTHQSGHPPFIEGDTHTREVRQTESPYRPDAAALAGRQFSEAQGSDSGSKTTAVQELQTSGEVRHRRSASSSRSSRETGCRWVLSKVID